MNVATRARVRVEGTVQGVGFRPFVYRLAEELRLTGWVSNDERGVLLEVEGPAETVELFLRRLSDEAPPLAAVEAVRAEEVAPTGQDVFAIVESLRRGEPDAPVSPDSATCDDCLRELFDPVDRRHRYPFVNCTNCGPRFTIVCGVPTTGRSPRWRASRCARPAAPSTRTRPTAVSMPSRTRARSAGRPCRCRSRSPHCPRARSSPSRAWAGITCAAAPMTSTRSPRSAAASTGRTSPLRSWRRTSPPLAPLWSPPLPRRSCSPGARDPS